MSIRERLSGNEATAIAMKQINPDVVAAFPITPSTEIPQYFSTFVSNGEVDTEFVAVESEHSAMSATIGAEAAGARAMTATSANGLSLMWEMIYIASSLRLPIVMALVNRAVSGPLNIHNDHSDAMGVRDAGWIMLFSENNQEAYDNMLMAHRIAEHCHGSRCGVRCLKCSVSAHSETGFRSSFAITTFRNKGHTVCHCMVEKSVHLIVKVQICIDMRRTIVVCGHLVWLLFHVYLLFRQPDKQVTYIIA